MQFGPYIVDFASAHSTLVSLRNKTVLSKRDRKELAEATQLVSALKWFRLGADATGDGKPNLIVLQTEARECWMEVLELGKTIKEIHSTDGACGAHLFQDRDGDGFPEITSRDNTFYTWTGYGPDKAVVYVVEERHGTRYQFAARYMRRPAPSGAKLAKLAKKAAVWQSRVPLKVGHIEYGALLYELLELVYSGNAASAKNLLALVHPQSAPLRQRWWAAFKKQLRKSRHYKEVLQINAGSL